MYIQSCLLKYSLSLKKQEGNRRTKEEESWITEHHLSSGTWRKTGVCFLEMWKCADTAGAHMQLVTKGNFEWIKWWGLFIAEQTDDIILS